MRAGQAQDTALRATQTRDDGFASRRLLPPLSWVPVESWRWQGRTQEERKNGWRLVVVRGTRSSTLEDLVRGTKLKTGAAVRCEINSAPAFYVPLVICSVVRVVIPPFKSLLIFGAKKKFTYFIFDLLNKLSYL
uniref:Uncharacterized protein n=1 Tax=Oryza punctata TaxID=4537 RepID=A0A0E0L3H5_ORYPU